MQRRVVITGLGLISPFGIGKEIFWDSLIEGRSGIRRLTRFDPTGYGCQVAGEIPDDSYKDLIEQRRLRRMSHTAQLASAGTRLALEDAGLNPNWSNPYTVGAIVGTAVGSLKEGLEQQSILLERGANRINPFITLSLHISSISTEVAITAQAQGTAFTVAGGCASSLCAIGTAADLIRAGTLDICLTGGAESPFFPLLYAGLCRTQELATNNDPPESSSCPFDQRHSGLVPSEGSCIIVLEEREHAKQRGALIYGELSGYALGCEAYDAFGLEPTGTNAVKTLQTALARAEVEPKEIDWINAHGSSCPQWDRKETRVIKEVLGPAAYSLPISGTKSMTGHSFGAAASFQVASTVLAMQHGAVPPTINLDTPDPECDLDYVPNHARSLTPKICLINSFAYGGVNSFLLLRSV